MTRTRFAPSPTGFLHVGGIRTALFSWLVAKHDGGEFFLRLEDTDQERYAAGSPRQIIESFQWLGLDLDGGPDHDELKRMKVDEDWPEAMADGEFRGVPGPFVQSQRLDIYKRHAEMLIASGHAYRANETSEELEAMRKTAEAERRTFVFSEASRLRGEIDPASPHVIRFKLNRSGQTVIDDLILGQVVFENANMASDPVILKSDGYATYHLAAMVDDHLQAVTHVIRAQEWLASAPIHVQIIQALGWALPHFAHVPAVNGNDGKKLSKRTGAQSVFDFRDQGYLREAMLNHLVLLGWAPGNGSTQDIFTLDELIQQFSLAHVGKSPAVFDFKKLDAINSEHIKRLSPEDLAERMLPYLAKDGLHIDTPERHTLLVKVIPLIQTRIVKLTEAAGWIDFFFGAAPTPERDQLIGPKMEHHLSLHALRESMSRLNALPADGFTAVAMEETLRVLLEQLSLKPNQLFSIVRYAVTGKSVTPPLFESMEALGRDAVMTRLTHAVAVLE
jgi:glutamyl-tRNA synthetase